MIIAIDPGLTTGYATLHDGEFRSGQLKFMDFLDWAYNKMVYTGHVEQVICEAFVITQATAKKTQAPWSLESIGAIRFFCHHKDIPFKLQKPADAMRFATDDRLQRMGWYKRGKGHANDATRHLFIYQAQHGGIPPEVLIP